VAFSRGHSVETFLSPFVLHVLFRSNPSFNLFSSCIAIKVPEQFTLRRTKLCINVNSFDWQWFCFCKESSFENVYAGGVRYLNIVSKSER
jgi:hypothetical protein